ncbi:MAG: hypothetical protein LBQ31_03115 [Bacteroidales bacterium]|nr:hypothetical protein [Bacteroidales bacterium]
MGVPLRQAQAKSVNSVTTQISACLFHAHPLICRRVGLSLLSFACPQKQTTRPKSTDTLRTINSSQAPCRQKDIRSIPNATPARTNRHNAPTNAPRATAPPALARPTTPAPTNAPRPTARSAQHPAPPARPTITTYQPRSFASSHRSARRPPAPPQRLTNLARSLHPAARPSPRPAQHPAPPALAPSAPPQRLTNPARSLHPNAPPAPPQ